MAIENLLDRCVPIWKRTAQGQKGQSELGRVSQQIPSDSNWGREVEMVSPELERAHVSNIGQRSFSMWRDMFPGCYPTCHHPPDVTLTFEVPKQEASGEGDKQKNNDQDSDDHLPPWAALLHLLGVHGREELHPFIQVVHVLGEEGRQDSEKAVLKAWFGEVEPQSSLKQVWGQGMRQH